MVQNDGYYKIKDVKDVMATPTCPQCGSKRVWKDGLRQLSDGAIVQRWLCRDCGYRFSDPQKPLKERIYTVFIVE